MQLVTKLRRRAQAGRDLNKPGFELQGVMLGARGPPNRQGRESRPPPGGAQANFRVSDQRVQRWPHPPNTRWQASAKTIGGRTPAIMKISKFCGRPSQNFVPGLLLTSPESLIAIAAALVDLTVILGPEQSKQVAPAQHAAAAAVCKAQGLLAARSAFSAPLTNTSRAPECAALALACEEHRAASRAHPSLPANKTAAGWLGEVGSRSFRPG